MDNDTGFLKKIIAVSEQAGSLIMEWYTNETCQIIHKADASPLTEADLASDSFIGEALSSTGIPVISEEKDCPFPVSGKSGTASGWWIPLTVQRIFSSGTGNLP